MERNQVEITVTDNGNGIAISPALDIYEPFVTSARNSGHIGLGMYLVHKWVTIALRGTIKQETPADGGCRFVIVIPMRAEVTFGDGRSM